MFQRQRPDIQSSRIKKKKNQTHTSHNAVREEKKKVKRSKSGFVFHKGFSIFTPCPHSVVNIIM